MINPLYPGLNDIAPSWADIQATFTADGGTALGMVDIAAIKWASKLDVGTQKGASGGRVMARTVGEVSYEASATLYRSGLRRLLKSLMEKAPTRGNQVLVGRVAFDILIQHSVEGDPEIYTTKIKGCRYLGASDDMKEGTEADKLEINLNPIEIVQIIDGKEVALI